MGRFLLLLILLMSTSEGRLDVYINSTAEGGCSRNSSITSCSSIELFAKEYANTSNVAVHVSGKVTVATLVEFHNISDLSISGEYSGSKTEMIARLECYPEAHSSSCHQASNNAGFQFVEVQTLRLANVRIVGCGGDHLFRSNITIWSAVLVRSCRDVTIEDVTIMSSKQTTLFIENTSGNVFLKNVHIQDNILTHSTTQPKQSFAGGLQIYMQEFTDKSRYEITNCRFFNISTPNYTRYDPRDVDTVLDYAGYGLGGGMSIILDKKSSQHTVLVDNCTFESITAPWGAGMQIKVVQSCSKNFISVDNSIFQNCNSTFAGGGLGIGFARQSENETSDNHVCISNSYFKNNRAKYGAGLYVFAFYGDRTRSENILFINCSWIENKAAYGAAVEISPSSYDHLNTGLLPVPVFRDCNFIGNEIVFKERKRSEKVTVGIFVISRFVVVFERTIYFDSNNYSALLLNSGRILIRSNSKLTFTNNRGLRGGAVSMHSFSSILVGDNCSVEFINNTAAEYGGAIYQHTTNMREFFFASRTCFLEYDGSQDTLERNVSFIFDGNKAPISGSSIFASSFHACYIYSRSVLDGHNIIDFLGDIGNFTLDPTNRTDESQAPALGTIGSDLEFSNETSNVVSAIPGMNLFLPLSVRDELEQEYQTEFLTRIVQDNKSTSVRVNGTYTTNRFIRVHGCSHEKADLIASTQDEYRIIQHRMVVELLPCPPGFYFDEKELSCKCSAYDKARAFRGITKCNTDNFTAVIQSGYWAGYYNLSDPGSFYTAVCPYQFCNLRTESGQEYSLPHSKEALSTFVCNSGRKGVLCGQCNESLSTYYHSRILTCGREDNCSYGFLLYVVSELIPMFIFFTLVIVFDVSFTSGAKNGFVFFCQMIIILPQDFSSSSSEALPYFQTGYNLFYRIFSITFFLVESLSFCLFKGATVMDILAFKYVTVLLALILVVSVVVSVNYCTCCSKHCSSMKKKVTASTSVLHGLSAFIVICYAECVRVSFVILRQTVLLGERESVGPNVAFYAGIDYLQGEHIRYAIPAIVSLGTIGLVPPVLLLFYPSILKLLALCKLSEHRLVTAILRMTRINSLMPMFDVFQGCFKDDLRFFSGLYFFYRVALLAPYTFSVSRFHHALIAELVLLILLGVHSITQPYKVRKHNIIDSLLFLDLAVINGFTLQLLKTSPESEQMFLAISCIQLLLIYAPMVVLVLYCIMKLVGVVRSLLSKKVDDESEQEFLVHLDDIDRLAEDSLEMSAPEFHSRYKQCREKRL